jgi:hypothetical protein
MHDHGVRHTRGGVGDEAQVVRTEAHRLLRLRRQEDVHLALVPPQRAPQLLRAEILSEGGGVGEGVGRFGLLARGRAQRLSDVAEDRVGVDQDRRATAGEGRGEVRGHERDPRAAAAAVHRDHRAPSGRLLCPPDGGRRGYEQIVTFLGPQEIPAGTRSDRRPE